jgi:hypothetical protein
MSKGSLVLLMPSDLDTKIAYYHCATVMDIRKKKIHLVCWDIYIGPTVKVQFRLLRIQLEQPSDPVRAASQPIRAVRQESQLVYCRLTGIVIPWTSYALFPYGKKN